MIWNIHESRGNEFLKNPSNILQEVLLSKCKTNIKFSQLAHRRGNIPIHMQMDQEEGKVYCKEALFWN